MVPTTKISSHSSTGKIASLHLNDPYDTQFQFIAHLPRIATTYTSWGNVCRHELACYLQLMHKAKAWNVDSFLPQYHEKMSDFWGSVI